MARPGLSADVGGFGLRPSPLRPFRSISRQTIYRVKSPVQRVHNAEIQPGVGGDGKPSCISLAGAMCSRRERAFSTCQGHRTTALPSPCLDTLRTSARAHAVAPRARASPCFAQPMRGTRPHWSFAMGTARSFQFHGVRASHSHEKQALEPGKPARPSGSGVPAAQESFLGCPILHKPTYGPP